MSKITGYDAIAYAEHHDIELHKYADPTDGARMVTPAEAREIAAEDPSLIYLDHTGWTEGKDDGGNTCRVNDGYNAADYFRDGEYLGADDFGIEPICE